MTVGHERYEQDVGAYLLGALPALEAEVFERHLMGCEACREELERLRPAVEALPRSVDPHEPPPSLRRSLMRTVEAEAADRAPARAPSRARIRLPALRPRIALAAASMALVAAASAGYVLRGDPGPDGDARLVAASVDRTALPGASARLEVPDEARRPAVLRVDGMPIPASGRVYELWLERDGEVRPAGVFSVTRDGRGSAVVPAGVGDAEAVLVTRERAGGAARPSEPPVIRVRL